MRMLDRIKQMLLTRTFAFAWFGLIFATQAGSHVNDGGELGAFIFHFLNIALAGYIVGFALANHLYADILEDLAHANHGLGEALQEIMQATEDLAKEEKNV